MWPSEKCSDGGPLEVLTFRYTPCECQESDNNQGRDFSCVDFTRIPNEDVSIECVGSDGMSIDVSPSTIAPDETFTVRPSGGGNLPESITCTSFDSSGDAIQEVTINTSGAVNLELKDKFGSLTLESCNDITCIEELCYTYTFDNIGNSEMEINVAERYFNGEVFDLVPFLPVNPLEPGESTTIEEKTIIDVCEERTYCVDLTAEASPENGEPCFANDTFKFSIEPPPVTPTPRPTRPPRTPPPRTPRPVSSAVPQ